MSALRKRRRRRALLAKERQNAKETYSPSTPPQSIVDPSEVPSLQLELLSPAPVPPQPTQQPIEQAQEVKELPYNWTPHLYTPLPGDSGVPTVGCIKALTSGDYTAQHWPPFICTVSAVQYNAEKRRYSVVLCEGKERCLVYMATQLFHLFEQAFIEKGDIVYVSEYMTTTLGKVGLIIVTKLQKVQVKVD